MGASATDLLMLALCTKPGNNDSKASTYPVGFIGQPLYGEQSDVSGPARNALRGQLPCGHYDKDVIWVDMFET
jgi:hypothetical protein